ncbi:hypothetical protein [Variovorax sp. Varisp62]|uniref:hypothetical protein n=1 Tax=Variovorax sp. Varisp62 TaxID=3243049 RepID=UPI0039B5A631
MSIKPSQNQKEKLFANHDDAIARGPIAILTLKPVFAVFTSSPVSHLLSTMRSDQNLRPEKMLVAYAANRSQSNEVLCLLQRADRSCLLAFWNLEVLGAKARALRKSVEVLDLADDSIEFVNTCSALNPFAVDGSRFCGRLNNDPRRFELALTSSSSAADHAALRPSLQLYEMDEQRLTQLRSLATQRQQPAIRWRYRRLR